LLFPSSSTERHFQEAYNISKPDSRFPLNKIIFTSIMDENVNLMIGMCYVKILLNLNPPGTLRINYYILYIIYRIYYISYIVYYISYIIYHILYIIYYISYITYHILYIIYHILYIIYYISYIVYHIFYIMYYI